MSRRLIRWEGRLVERAAFEFFERSNVTNPVPRQCPECSGMGSTLEEFDRERLPEAVTCWRCKGEGVLMPKQIEAEWMSYRRRVVPVGASATQITETKRAFFAGAWAYNHLVMRGLSPGPESTPPDEKFLRELHAEMIAFNDEVTAGRA